MKSMLFSPIQLRELTLANRIVVAPMCQYSATDGRASDWHVMHMGQFAVSGSGMFMTEATAVTPEGRISDRCLGLYSDETEEALARVITFCKAHGKAALCVQLAHAGRKGSTRSPETGLPPGPLDDGGWQTVAPSAIPFDTGWPTPQALDEAGMGKIREAFVNAARRADRIGFDAIELHAAHGYLMAEFLSPLGNRREDAYGGSLENRMRFPLEVFDAVRAVWPDSKPLGIRISATEWVDDGWQLSDTITFAKELKNRNCDFIHISSGGGSPDAAIKGGPGYQVPLATRVRQETGMVVIAVGLITDSRQAETIIRTEQADMVALGRHMLFDPHWAWRAASELGAEASYPYQYTRAHPSFWSTPHPPGKPPASNR